MTRYYLVAFLIAFFVVEVQAIPQPNRWKPKFVLLDLNDLHRTGGDLSNYLASSIKKEIEPCKAEIGIFYFRVNDLGKVDTIYVEGNLRKSIELAITQNIKRTEGKWQLPDNTRKGDQCWFIYPYYTIGNSFNCSQETIAIINTVKATINMLNGLNRQTEGRHGVLISPPSSDELSRK